MQLGEISFCDKVGYNVRSDELKKKVLQELEAEYGFKVIQRHFDRFSPDAHVPLLQRVPHAVATRSNGNPYLLYLTKINFVNVCVFIDKKVQQGYFYPRMIAAKLWFDDALFDNTLLDGEMIKDRGGRWTFLLGDLIADSGRMLANVPFPRRLQRLHALLDAQFVADTTNVCDVRVKRYFSYAELGDGTVDAFLGALPYTCRGLYFKPPLLKHRDILHNFDDSLVVKVQRTKYKELGAFLTAADVAGAAAQAQPTPRTPPTQPLLREQERQEPQAPPDGERTLAVMKTGQSDVYEVYDEHGAARLGVACVNRVQVSKLLRAAFAGTTPLTKLRLVCRWVEAFQKWEPLRLA